MTQPQRHQPQRNRPQRDNQGKKQGTPPTEPKKAGKGVGCLLVIGILVLTVGLPVFFAGLDEGWFSGADDNDMTITVPTQQEATDLAAQLAVAEKAHGVCYGWSLVDLNDTAEQPLSMGSSKGVGTDAEECGRFVALRVEIDYASPSSDLEDSAHFRVSASGDLTPDAPSSLDLERMGVTPAAAIDDPAATVGMGVLALPLLMVEKGAADALPVVEAAGAPATPISRPGSDFIGNNSGAFVALGIIGGIAVLCLIIGIIVRTRAGKAR